MHKKAQSKLRDMTSSKSCSLYVPWSRLSRFVGDGHPTFYRKPYNGYINPYYWVDDHPLLYGHDGSLDPGTIYANALYYCMHLMSIVYGRITLLNPQHDIHSSTLTRGQQSLMHTKYTNRITSTTNAYEMFL